MPRLSARQARARDVLKTFADHHTTRIKQALRRTNQLRRTLANAGLTPQDLEELMAPASLAVELDAMAIDMKSDSEADTDPSVSLELSSESDSSSSDNWSDLLGSDWRRFSSSSDSSSSSADSSFESGSDDEMPELHPAGYPDSDEEDGSDSESSGSDSGDDGDDEEDGLDGDVEGFVGLRSNNLTRWVRHSLEEMYAHRYEAARDTFPRGPAFLPHVLGTMKDTRPDLFRQELRMSPYTFDKLVEKLEGDRVFANNSHNPQMPVEDQLAITLFRFGHSGNATSLQKVANWAGVAKGTVTLVTRRIMEAVLRPEFMAEAVCMPTAPEKEQAKSWVERHSCKAWRNGWCMVDGTLVSLFNRPFWFGESYFDRKCNYSLNIQVRTSDIIHILV
ncbi:hypothetical protein B0H19DRAFT_1322962 [Mycena capillaripes]|nr:hypothetical protein B0H19DRAFT_1322962 [Mycena capillaripes]